jgi:hypothetical protein
MRHSDINLTMTTYTKLADRHIAAELERLPSAALLKSSAVACNVSCTSAGHAGEQEQRNTRENSGAAGTRTQNQRIMSPLL